MTEAPADTGDYVGPSTCLASVTVTALEGIIITSYAYYTDVATEARESCDLTNGAPGLWDFTKCALSTLPPHSVGAAARPRAGNLRTPQAR